MSYYTGLNLSHGGVYAVVVHLVVYYLFLPESIKNKINSYRCCSAGAIFLLIKLSKEISAIPSKYFKDFPATEHLNKLLDLKWHNLNVIKKAYYYNKFLKSLDKVVPTELKKLTFNEVSALTDDTLYSFETTKIKFILPSIERFTFSSLKTPNECVFRAAISSANPLCFHSEEYYLCNGAYDYDLFGGEEGNILHITTQSQGKDKQDVIYVPKHLKSVEDILDYLENTYQFIGNRLIKDEEDFFNEF